MGEMSEKWNESTNLSNDAIEINNNLEQLKLMIKNCDADGIEFLNKINSYELNHCKTKPTAQASDNNSQCNVYEDKVKEELRQKWGTLRQMRMKFFNSIRNVIDLLTVVQRTVIDEQLGKWRNERILAHKYGNQSDIKSPTHIDQIQIWFERLLELICKTQTSINIVRNAENQQNFSNEIEEKIDADIIVHLQELVRSSLIVENQPPQVIKKDKRYAQNNFPYTQKKIKQKRNEMKI